MEADTRLDDVTAPGYSDTALCKQLGLRKQGRDKEQRATLRIYQARASDIKELEQWRPDDGQRRVHAENSISG